MTVPSKYCDFFDFFVDDCSFVRLLPLFAYFLFSWRKLEIDVPIPVWFGSLIVFD